MSDSDQTQSTVAREHLKRLARLRQLYISDQQRADRDGRDWARRILDRVASGSEPKPSRFGIDAARRALGLGSRGGVK